MVDRINMNMVGIIVEMYIFKEAVIETYMSVKINLIAHDTYLKSKFNLEYTPNY